MERSREDTAADVEAVRAETAAEVEAERIELAELVEAARVAGAASTVRSFRRYTRSALAGFLILLVGNMYVVHTTATQDAKDKARLTENRLQIVGELCAADNDFAAALRTALDGQIAFIRRSREPAPPTLQARINAVKKLQREIPTANCAARLSLVRKAPGGGE